MSGLNLEIITGRELRRVAVALRKIDVQLPVKLRAELRADAAPMVAEAKQAALSIDVNKADKHHLRRMVSRGVGVKVLTGKSAGIRIVTKVPTNSEFIIPRGLDSDKGWRHPVFGNREIWVTQHSKTPSHWFMDSMQRGAVRTIRNVQKTVEAAAEYVAANAI